jgi:hypothetical protein
VPGGVGVTGDANLVLADQPGVWSVVTIRRLISRAQRSISKETAVSRRKA